MVGRRLIRHHFLICDTDAGNVRFNFPPILSISILEPGMYLGLTNKVLSFEEVFGVRKRETQFKMDQKEEEFIHRIYPYSRRVIAA